MRPARAFPEESVQKLRVALKQAKKKCEYQRIQCLWLRAALGLRKLAARYQTRSCRRAPRLSLHQGRI